MTGSFVILIECEIVIFSASAGAGVGGETVTVIGDGKVGPADAAVVDVCFLTRVTWRLGAAVVDTDAGTGFDVLDILDDCVIVRINLI